VDVVTNTNEGTKKLTVILRQSKGWLTTLTMPLITPQPTAMLVQLILGNLQPNLQQYAMNKPLVDRLNKATKQYLAELNSISANLECPDELYEQLEWLGNKVNELVEEINIEE
jgi:hypothetical protein